MVAADWLREFAEATGNPLVLSFGAHCLRFRFPRCKSRPRTRRSAPGPGTIAQDGGSPFTESILVLNLARLEAEHADPLAALDHITLAIRNYHDSGNTSTMRTPLAILATLFDRLSRLSQAERPMHSTSGHAAVRLQPFWSELVFTACTYATTARA